MNHDQDIIRQAEIIAEMIETERCDAISEYKRWSKYVDQLESELDNACYELQKAKDTLETMNIQIG
jgi:hypothetical protein